MSGGCVNPCARRVRRVGGAPAVLARGVGRAGWIRGCRSGSQRFGGADGCPARTPRARHLRRAAQEEPDGSRRYKPRAPAPLSHGISNRGAWSDLAAWRARAHRRGVTARLEADLACEVLEDRAKRLRSASVRQKGVEAAGERDPLKIDSAFEKVIGGHNR